MVRHLGLRWVFWLSLFVYLPVYGTWRFVARKLRINLILIHFIVIFLLLLNSWGNHRRSFFRGQVCFLRILRSLIFINIALLLLNYLLSVNFLFRLGLNLIIPVLLLIQSILELDKFSIKWLLLGWSTLISRTLDIDGLVSITFKASVHLGLHPNLVRRLLQVCISVELLAIRVAIGRILPVRALQVAQTMAVGSRALRLLMDLLQYVSWVLLHRHQRGVLESFILAPVERVVPCMAHRARLLFNKRQFEVPSRSPRSLRGRIVATIGHSCQHGRPLALLGVDIARNTALAPDYLHHDLLRWNLIFLEQVPVAGLGRLRHARRAKQSLFNEPLLFFA